MKEFYSPKNIEIFVQKYWYDNNTFKANNKSNKKKFYCLSMMPYPSGSLHMGHVRNYTIGDVIARYQRMLGKNVLHPIGWDAFGLPTEKAAIDNNIDPSTWTYNNINYMRNQLKNLGFSYDWDREIITCDPKYYKWEQWFFIKLYNKGLAYKKNSLVNWCDNDQTVLANEQVINGCCWRCDNIVIKKNIPHWFIKITKYANELLNDLDQLNNWPKKVKLMQRNWIGKSKYIEIKLYILNTKKIIIVYTKKIEMILEATFILISISHKLSIYLSKKNSLIKKFIKKIYRLNNLNIDDKISDIYGINTNLYVINPLTNKYLPIWICNYVLTNYGSEAIMGTPKYNKYDFMFAKKYLLPTNTLIIKNQILLNIQNKLYSNKTYFLNLYKNKNLYYINNKIIEYYLIKKKLLNKKNYFKLKDWGISRQRYWGAPIPMLTINNNIVPVSENKLPIILPKIKLNYKYKLSLNNFNNWVKTKFNGKLAFRETDTFDTFMESSWYYARYTSNKYENGIFDYISANYWLPVDQYIGGIEHAIMHLMYFRFYHKLLRDFGLVNSDEPVKRLLCQGMVLSDSFYYFNKKNKKIWVNLDKVIKVKNKNNVIIKYINNVGQNLIYNGVCKMSKSKNNGIDPQLIINKYGSDTLRLFIMFAAPVESELIWDESGIIGSNRFLHRLWNLVYLHVNLGLIKKLNCKNLNIKQIKLLYEENETIKKVTDDIDRRQKFNTAISSIMILFNKVIKFNIKDKQDKYLVQNILKTIIKLLYPFTPHICFILWKYLDNNNIIDKEKWPVYNCKKYSEENKTIIIQINGKFFNKIFVPNIIINNNNVINYIVNNKLIKQKLNNKKIKKIIYINKKIINLLI